MQTPVRDRLYVGLAIALAAALFLIWLWRPEHQVRRHTDDLLRSLSHKNWSRFADFIAVEYKDQWGNDRRLLLERTREVFQYLNGVEIKTIGSDVRVENRRALWNAII